MAWRGSCFGRSVAYLDGETWSGTPSGRRLLRIDVTVGFIAGIGFTVALFIATLALPQDLAEEAKEKPAPSGPLRR